MDGVQALVRRAVEAAVSVARGVGLRCTEPAVLSARGNALVHLAPAPVVARVSTLTAWTRRDPAEWLGREVAVAATAATRGGPVVAPTALVDPGPYWVDGLALTLWTHVEQVHAGAQAYPRRATGRIGVCGSVCWGRLRCGRIMSLPWRWAVPGCARC